MFGTAILRLRDFSSPQEKTVLPVDCSADLLKAASFHSPRLPCSLAKVFFFSHLLFVHYASERLRFCSSRKIAQATRSLYVMADLCERFTGPIAGSPDITVE